MNQTAALSRAFALAWTWVLALAAALLAACSTLLPDKPARPASYDLGLPAATTASGAASQPPLALPAVTAPAALDGPAMLYRLAYKNEADQPHPYARAR